jgi:hypothetical protein
MSATGRVKLQRLVCKRRVADPEDLERGSIDTELGLGSRGDVDLRQDAEALSRQGVTDDALGSIES